MVWIVEWTSDYDDSERNLFDSRDAAYKAAAFDIQQKIKDYLDKTDASQVAECKVINDNVKKAYYDLAVGDFSSSDFGWGRVSVYKENPAHANDIDDPEVFDDAFFNAPVNTPIPSTLPTGQIPTQHISLKNMDKEDLAGLPSPAKKISCGAKCRCCGTFNEYAEADKPDGTYKCYSCKSLNMDKFGPYAAISPKTWIMASDIWNKASDYVNPAVAKNPEPTEMYVEKPCRNCGRKNDRNALKCWWCEVKNPYYG